MKNIKNFVFLLVFSICLNFLAYTSVYAQNITLNVKDAPVKDVIGALSKISGQSIVVDDSVQGQISLDLKDVPFDLALDLVTNSKGLTYKTMDNVIIVSTFENIKNYYSNFGVYKLNYIKAEDAQKSISGILKSDGLTADTQSNSILFSGSKRDEDKLKSLLSQIDVPGKQVTIEAKIVSIDKSKTGEFGFKWDWDSFPSSDETYDGVLHLGHGYTSSFQTTLAAQITNGNADILATPRVMTLPGKEASIFIGDSVPVVTESVSDGESTYSTTYVDAGIKLTYTPIISNDGYITTNIHAEVSSATLVDELENYKITSRTVDTTARMKAGECLIIGGLIDNTEETTYTSVPLLSKIPVLGQLFKNKYSSKEKTEVIIVITAYLSDSGKAPVNYDPAKYESKFGKGFYAEKEPAKVKEKTKVIANKNSQVIESNGNLTMREKAERILGRTLPK
jgi:protein transport protein HofQ/type IV pilus assembly protein PilQ